MSKISKPDYVEWSGQQAFCQPGRSTGVHFYSFVLQADRTALRTLCTKFFDRPSGGVVEVRPLSSKLLLSFADIGRVQSLRAPDCDMGWAPELNAIFCFPVLVRGPDLQQGLRAPDLRDIAWFIAYIIVDTSWACVSGREIYGFPKGLGEFSVPRTFADPDAEWWVKTLVFKTFDRDTRGHVEQLVHIRRDRPLHGSALSNTKTELTEAYRDLLGHLDDGDGYDVPELKDFEALVIEEKGIRQLPLPFMFLKEFRDSVDGRKACYQAIIRAPLLMHNLRIHGTVTGHYEVTLGQYASHPLVSELGLGGPVLRPTVALYTEYDFDLDVGVPLWEA